MGLLKAPRLTAGCRGSSPCARSTACALRSTQLTAPFPSFSISVLSFSLTLTAVIFCCPPSFISHIIVFQSSCCFVVSNDYTPRQSPYFPWQTVLNKILNTVIPPPPHTHSFFSQRDQRNLYFFTITEPCHFPLFFFPFSPLTKNHFEMLSRSLTKKSCWEFLIFTFEAQNQL